MKGDREKKKHFLLIIVPLFPCFLPKLLFQFGLITLAQFKEKIKIKKRGDLLLKVILEG